MHKRKVTCRGFAGFIVHSNTSVQTQQQVPLQEEFLVPFSMTLRRKVNQPIESHNKNTKPSAVQKQTKLFGIAQIG